MEFTIPEGEAAIADLTHDGDDNFIVIPFTAGGRLSSLVIETGEYAGAVIFNTRPEEQAAALEIEADGAWTIAIKPITAAKVWDTATSLDGTGDDVYQLDPPPAGLVTLDLAYQGDDNFIIPYTADGERLSSLVIETGDFSARSFCPRALPCCRSRCTPAPGR